MASILDADYDSAEAENASGSRIKSARTKKREFPPALALFFYDLSVTTFASLMPTGLHPWLAYYFLFLTYSSPAAPSNNSTHVDGSGTPAAGAE